MRTVGSMRGGVRFAFNNKAGSVSDVMENDQYYAVFNVDSLIEEGHKSFESVKTQLVNKVRRKKQKEASRDIIDELVIDLNANEKTLSSIIESQ